MSGTPITSAVEARCFESLRLFSEMSADNRSAQLPELIGCISNEILVECRRLETALSGAEKSLRRYVEASEEGFVITDDDYCAARAALSAIEKIKGE